MMEISDEFYKDRQKITVTSENTNALRQKGALYGTVSYQEVK